jgi:phage gp36-like protein
MSRYIEWEDVANSYPDWPKAASANTVGNLWIPRAEDEVDARLAPKYSVPFTPVPGVVRDLCIDLAYYKLAFATEKGKELKESLKERFEALLDGSMVLTTSGAVLASGQAWSTHQDYHTSFGVDTDLNWQVPDAQAEDQQEARDQI